MIETHLWFYAEVGISGVKVTLCSSPLLSHYLYHIAYYAVWYGDKSEISAPPSEKESEIKQRIVDVGNSREPNQDQGSYAPGSRPNWTICQMYRCSITQWENE